MEYVVILADPDDPDNDPFDSSAEVFCESGGGGFWVANCPDPEYAELIAALLNKHESERAAEAERERLASLRLLRYYCHKAGYHSVGNISHLGGLVRKEYERRYGKAPDQRQTQQGLAFVYGPDDEPWITNIIVNTLGEKAS